MSRLTLCKPVHLQPVHLLGLQATDVVFDWIFPLLGVAAVIAAMMWLLAYTTRFFEYLKMQESKWFGRDTLDFTKRFLSFIWIVLSIVLILFLLQFPAPEARAGFEAAIRHVPAALFVAFVLFVAIVFVRVFHHFAAYLRGELRTKPRQPAPPGALMFTELGLKYVIYVIAGITAFVGGVQALPAEDQPVKDVLSGVIRTEQWSAILTILAVSLFLGFILDRAAHSVFEDLKKRSRKFSPRVIDQFKSATRVALFFIIGVTALFLLLNLVLDPTRLFVFGIGFLALVVVAALAAMGTLQEAVAGIGLMMSDAFDVGDRVKIGGDLVCDVIGIYVTMTQVRTLKGELVNLPNSWVRREPIVNFSRSQAYAMFLELSVGFDVPSTRVRDLLLEAARTTPGILETPPPEVYGKDVSGSTLQYQLLAYTREPERMKQIKSDLVFRLQETFRRSGIIPGLSTAGSRTHSLAED